MRKLVAAVMALTVGVSLASAQDKDTKKALEDSLKASYKMTRTSGIASNQVTEAGTVFVIQKKGLAADLATNATAFTSRVRNNEVGERGGAAGLPSRGSTKRLDVGDRVFMTDIDIKDDRVRSGS